MKTLENWAELFCTFPEPFQKAVFILSLFIKFASLKRFRNFILTCESKKEIVKFF